MKLQEALDMLNRRLLVASPQLKRCRVVSVTPFVNADGTSYNIVNLNVVTPYAKEHLVSQLKENGKDWDGFQVLNLSNQDRQFQFVAGQIVDANIELVELKDKETGEPNGEKALLCTSISAVAANTSTTKMELSLDALLAELDDDADVENLDDAADDGAEEVVETKEPAKAKAGK